MTVNDHGSASTYVHHKCRCDSCTEANSKRASDARARRRQQQPPIDAHGKADTYTNWDCRCELCRAAWNAAMRRYKKTGTTRVAASPLPEEAS